MFGSRFIKQANIYFKTLGFQQKFDRTKINGRYAIITGTNKIKDHSL